MDLTQQEVEKVAGLSWLELTENENAVLAKQLNKILTQVETLKQSNTTGIEATVLGQVSVIMGRR